MKKTIFLFIVSLAGLFCASAQNQYEYMTFTSSEGQTLNYRLLSPSDMTSETRFPLVIFLHGLGERGSDNEKQLTHGGQMFLNPVNQERYPAYVIYPQCPETTFWAYQDIPSSFDTLTPEKNMTGVFRALKEMIDEYRAKPTVDVSRVYIMGLSMGGMATYDMVSRFPDLFAAAIPICGAVAPGRLAAAKDVKFRIYHGDADKIVPVECSRRAYRELRKAGADVEYFEFPGCGHASWTPAFNQPGFIEWLFAQKKDTPTRKRSR